MAYEFDELYREFSPRIYKLCLSYSGDRLFADDLHQETWIAVWHSLPKFRNESKIGTWIYRIAINTCLVGLKKEKNKANDSENILAKLVQKETQDNSKEIARLYESISKLKEHERIIITLVLEEKPYDEIAEITGITENNLRVKIHRIKKELQQIYSSYGRI
ncbi:sigma-70 family RNA polymerase sigma factor [Kaistella daneshvariae]|jgi:RNA polymerase sigma-70 factor (ECF subfamily)|uniref:Sigma-70 family RNA polymerase sigma factor n=1 Tax=Kaistella daneshvariae TaxID=2487074 RepID=A0A3N0WSX6_9FLAO|nr:sigma-70 family RNA polymerase sigma factor [Kaistella daneshvariae]AZI67263.1 sigma-70 family RNA polymerase sigma factor [Kaistella daneshvariae]ROI08180.1 sigma-70 family RNA polymerase sigma factor [Kaistella daneshvariae]